MIEDYNVTHFDEVSSTMKTIKSASKPAVHIAKSQTKGIGQYGREWLSQPGKGIYLSLKNELLLKDDRYLLGMAQLGAITMAIVLANMGLDVKLKWPNDIYIKKKKLAGVIVEIINFKNHYCEYILGIGINLDAPFSINSAIGLNDVADEAIDGNKIISAFVKSWDEHTEQLAMSGLKQFQIFWQKHDYLVNKVIKVVSDGIETVGVSQGIDQLGQLKLTDKHGAELLFGHQASIINTG